MGSGVLAFGGGAGDGGGGGADGPEGVTDVATSVSTGNIYSYPYSAIVFIEATFPDGTVVQNTGVMIGRNDVLTSAQTIYSGPHGGSAISAVVTPGLDGTVEPYGQFAVVDFHDFGIDGNDSLSQLESASDMAVLALSSPIGDSTGYFGYGQVASSGTFESASFYSETSSEHRMFSDTYNLTLDDNGETYSFDINQNIIVDYGSPLWVFTESIPIVFGIASTLSYAAEVSHLGDDIFVATQANNFYLAISGQDTNDVLRGDDETNFMYGRSGDDTIFGGEGIDVLYGNKGLDVLVGGADGDVLFGGQNSGALTLGEGSAPALRDGVETLSGGDGTDIIYGNHGTDLLLGGADADTMYGGQDGDTLIGGGGDDLLFGNLGNDVFQGNLGADIFVASNGDDTIEDFAIADGDRISNSSARTTVEDASSGAIISFQDGTTVTLTGITASAVTSDFFL